MKHSFPIRFGIGFKLGLLLAAFSILATGLTGYYFYSTSRNMLTHAAERDLLTATQVVGRNIKIIIDVIAEDAQILAAIPVTGNIFVSPDELSAERDRKLLADTFAAVMTSHPEYFQIRLINSTQRGMELVRVDRNGKKLTRVTAAGLQNKGHYPYVSEALRLERGDIYLSDISINHERGAHSGLGKPTLTLSTPVSTHSGKVLGLIVINVDLEGLSRLLQVNLPKAYQLYLTNRSGDFLIHPDDAQTFGFDRGNRILVQDSFKPVLAMIHGNEHKVVMKVEAESPQQEGQVAAFVRLPFGDTIDRRFLVLGLAQPMDNITRETRSLSRDTLQIVLAFSGLALILAALVSRIVTGPLYAMVSAINRFSRERVISLAPLERNDELGLLSRSFHAMQTEIIAYLAELDEGRKQLDHLARHDTLTGLPNRRMFFDRLEHAIANSRRSGKQLAVLFVDLDRFKEINDTLGHAVGDGVLINVARLLKTSVRDVDTVARMGGDEFVILLDLIDNPQHVQAIAQKLHDRFQRSMQIDGRELHVHASMGIGIFPRDGKDAEELIQNADRAMYIAKNQGRNTFGFFPTGSEKQAGA